MEPEDRFMSIRAAAQTFGIQEAHLYSLVNEGIIPCTIMRSKRVTYRNMLKFVAESDNKNYKDPKNITGITIADLESDDDDSLESKGA